MDTAETSREPETLGLPSIGAAGLRVWVHGRQFPSAHDPDEGNRLRATIWCEADGVSVKSDDANIRASDIARWATECRALLKGTSALARLSVKKHVFEVVFQATEDLERIRMHVAVVPGDGAKAQSFDFDLFRVELEALVGQCDQVLDAYPVRGGTLPVEG
jgi:hypothetical protein